MKLYLGESKKGGRVGFLFLLIIALFLYAHVLYELYLDWGVNDDYSHGYFIPIIVLYMVFTLKDELQGLKDKPWNLGLLLLISGLAVLVVGKTGSEFFLQRTSFIFTILGLILFMLGPGHLRILLVPVLYLIFMIPLPAIIWNKIAFPMQLFGSYLTENLISLLGIPVFREGNVLHLAETTLEVVAACSGLRSLMTMFALAGIMAFLASLPRWKKTILFFSAAPIAIVANIVRLTGTALLASFYGSEVAQGFLHDFSGIAVFILGLTLLVCVNNLLSRTQRY